MKKVENHKLKNIEIFESIYKIGKNYKILWYWYPNTKILPT